MWQRMKLCEITIYQRFSVRCAAPQQSTRVLSGWWGGGRTSSPLDSAEPENSCAFVSRSAGMACSNLFPIINHDRSHNISNVENIHIMCVSLLPTQTGMGHLPEDGPALAAPPIHEHCMADGRTMESCTAVGQVLQRSRCIEC